MNSEIASLVAASIAIIIAITCPMTRNKKKNTTALRQYRKAIVYDVLSNKDIYIIESMTCYPAPDGMSFDSYDEIYRSTDESEVDLRLNELNKRLWEKSLLCQI